MIWGRDRFPKAGTVTVDYARRVLPVGSNDTKVEAKRSQLEEERDRVTKLIRDEVELLMRWGAEICGMTYVDKGSNMSHNCFLPRQMRLSFQQDEGLLNLKRLHWIFHELPWSLHEDVSIHRRTHRDLVVEKVMAKLNVAWAEKLDGESGQHRNILEKLYSRVVAEKRSTILAQDGLKFKRWPYVRYPTSKAKAMGAPNYRKGMKIFCWKSPTEPERLVSEKLVFPNVLGSKTNVDSFLPLL